MSETRSYPSVFSVEIVETLDVLISDEEPDDIIDVEIVGEEENPPLTTERKPPILSREGRE